MGTDAAGAMKIHVSNRQRLHRINTSRLVKLTRWLMGHVRQQAPRKTWAAVSVVVMDDKGIAQINKRFLNRAHPTDVISFTYDPLPGQPPEFMGEVLINVERAVAEARRRRQPASRELALYLAHGCQHLGGASDRTTKLRARMRRAERAWLRAAARARLLNGLVNEPPSRNV